METGLFLSFFFLLLFFMDLDYVSVHISTEKRSGQQASISMLFTYPADFFFNLALVFVKKNKCKTYSGSALLRDKDHT